MSAAVASREWVERIVEFSARLDADLAELIVPDRDLIFRFVVVAKENQQFYSALIIERFHSCCFALPADKRLPLIYLMNAIAELCPTPYRDLFEIESIVTDTFARATDPAIRRELVELIAFWKREKRFSLERLATIQVVAPESKKVTYQDFVAELYAPDPCRACGFRPTTQEAMTKHLDEHFKQNMLLRKRESGSVPPRVRGWFDSGTEWTGGPPAAFAPPVAAQEQKQQKVMMLPDEPQDLAQPMCPICRENFELYHDLDGEWFYKNTLRVSNDQLQLQSRKRSKSHSELSPTDSTIFHRDCLSESDEFRRQA